MAGMTMGSGSASAGKPVSVGGITAVPTQVLGSAVWQGMKITAQAVTAVPFVIYDGTSEHMVKPGPKSSFHLMVMLTDAQTGRGRSRTRPSGRRSQRGARSSPMNASGQ